MAMIVKDHGAIVVKSIGDSLLYYFPKTADFKPEHFVCPLKCAQSMVECADIINATMKASVDPITGKIDMNILLTGYTS